MTTRSPTTQIHRAHPIQGNAPHTTQSPAKGRHAARANPITSNPAEPCIATDGSCDDPYSWVYPYGYLY